MLGLSGGWQIVRQALGELRGDAAAENAAIRAESTLRYSAAACTAWASGPVAGPGGRNGSTASIARPTSRSLSPTPPPEWLDSSAAPRLARPRPHHPANTSAATTPTPR